MASTEAAGGIAALTQADLSAALQLSASAHWNQSEVDWLWMLAQGRAWCVRAIDAQGRSVVAASTLVLPYGERFAWVSMVLVLPAFQRRGLAGRLLRHALAALAAERRTAVLDATPAGQPVYRRAGFVHSWGFVRWRREAAPPASTRPPQWPATRPLRADDWPAIAALDEPAFGASRMGLLRSLASRLPQAARVAEQGGRLAGFVLGRDGRTASQIGPLVATDVAAASALLADAAAPIAGPLVLDVRDEQPGLQKQLPMLGFAPQRPFTRMTLGAAAPPGDAARVVLVAGPELG
jgi:GNAT superfamily N-acetyltransferase